MKLLRIILCPFVPVYAIIVRLRNWFFDINVFNEKKVNAKVVSVGNLTVGGSGKTPMVIYLANLLKGDERKVGVLSRGYGRKTKGYLLVSKPGKILVKVDECGDEIYHTAKVCDVAAAVSENRVDGAENLINDTNVDTILLDDAFQHRWIARNVNLLIFEQQFLLNKKMFARCMLPTGNMREPLSSIKRADAIIINRKFSEQKEIPEDFKVHFKDKIIFAAHYNMISFVDVKKLTEYSMEEFKGQQSLVVSGIANPYSFINALKQTNVNTTNQMIFRDHKDYTQKEIQEIRKEFYSTNAYSVVTTEKDAVKLSKFSKELDDIDIFYLKIELQIDDEAAFKNFINSKLN
jgi:tetraacyldisaccharide 4'-kinase